MTVSIVTNEVIELGGEGCKLAQISGDEVWIWPRGIGRGSAIVMSKKDWERITREVRLASMRASGQAAREALERIKRAGELK